MNAGLHRCFPAVGCQQDGAAALQRRREAGDETLHVDGEGLIHLAQRCWVSQRVRQRLLLVIIDVVIKGHRLALRLAARGGAGQRCHAMGDDAVSVGGEGRLGGVERPAPVSQIQEQILLDILRVHAGDATAAGEAPGGVADVLEGARRHRRIPGELLH